MTESELETLLHQGITAVKAGRRQEARDLLLKVVDFDETSLNGWLWLSKVLDSQAEREICLENVLTLDPEHQAALQALNRLRQQVTPQPNQAHVSTPAAPQAEPPLPTTPQPTPSPASPTQSSPAKRSAPSRYKRITPGTPLQNSRPAKTASAGRPASAQPQSASAVYQTAIDEADREEVQDLFANEYLCPYCAHPTRPDDPDCRACHHKLWLHRPRKPKPSKLYRFLTWSVGLNVAFYALMLLLVILAAANRPDDFSIGEFIAQMAFISLYGSYDVVVFIGYLKRWRIIYFLNVFGAVMVLIGAAGLGLRWGLTSLGGLMCGGTLFLLGMAWFFMILNLGDDFAFDKYRIRLCVDSDAKTATELLQRGNKYSQHKMWALAAVHFRRAASQMPAEITCHLALTLAYLNLKKYDRARAALAEAKLLNPTDPAVIKLANELEKKR